MSVAAVRHATPTAPPDEGIRPRRWTRDELYRALDGGVFGPEERLELLDGEILVRRTQTPPHACTLVGAIGLLAQAFGSGYHARSQFPLVLSNESEPEPDVTIVSGTPKDYVASHPTAADARLVVEVSDTTLRFDRGRKRAAYARAGIREYWILNLIDRQLEVHRNPSGGRYRSIIVYREHESATPLAAPDASIRVAELLPPSSTSGKASSL